MLSHNTRPISEQGIFLLILWYFIIQPFQLVPSSSHSISKSLSMIASMIPVWLKFPVGAHCVISADCLLHVASAVWHMEWTCPLNIWPSTSSQVQEYLYFTICHFWSSSDPLLCCQYIFFSWNIANFEACLQIQNPSINLKSPLVLSSRGSRWSHSSWLQYRAHFTSCPTPDWSKGCCNYLLSYLFNVFLLLRALCEIALLLDHLIERGCNQTVICNMHSHKTSNT